MEGLEILVLGDGRFVQTVLNAVSSIGRGDYGRLAALGAMLGLVGMVVRGAMSPQGPRFDPTVLLVSILMFWVIFVPRIDRVMVVEMMPPPGGQAPRTYVVDNVPLGLAAAGYFVSNVGLGITGLYDTVMGRADDTERVLTGGLGRNLMLMAGIREMVADPRFGQDSAGGEFGIYRQNLLSYLQDCTVPPINNGYVSSSALLRRPLEQGVFGAEFALPITHTFYRDSSSSTRDYVTCAVAQERLRNGMTSGALVNSFDSAAQSSRFHTSSDELVAAFTRDTGGDGVYAQQLLVGHMVNALVREAQVRGSVSPLESQAVIMVEEANLRRSTQWAAEENLFVRLLRPLVGFFEALFYALAPIMAFVVTLGPMGLSLLTKYLMLTVWVALWFPMLTITQLYSKIRMEDYFEQLGRLDLTPHQLDLIANEATTVLGATSALVAATPALAMSLIYGGAVSMSYLSRSIGHGDVVDEEKMSPKATSVPAAVQGSALRSYSPGEGATTPGGAKITFSESDFAESARASADQRLTETSMTAQQDIFRAVANGAQFSRDASQFQASSDTLSATRSFSSALREYQGQDQSIRQGSDLITSLSVDQQSLMMRAHAYAEQQGVSWQVGLAKVGSSMGYSESYINTILDQTSTSASTSETERLSNTKAIADAMSYGFSADDTTASQLARGTTTEVGQRLAESGSVSMSAEDGTRLSKSMREAESAKQMYSETHSAGWRAGRSTEMDVAQLRQNIMGNDQSRVAAMSAARMFDSGGEEWNSLREGRDTLKNSIMNSNAAMSRQEAHVMASSLYLMQNLENLPDAQKGEGTGHVVTILGQSTFQANPGSDNGASRYADIAGNADAGQQATHATAGVTGAQVSYSAVHGAAGSTVASAGTDIQADAAHLEQQASTQGVTSSDFAGANPAAAASRFEGDAAVRREDHIAVEGWRRSEEMQEEQRESLVQAAQANPTPTPSAGIFGPNAPAWTAKAVTVDDYATRVQDFTRLANEFEAEGDTERAAAIRAVRDEQTIPAMVEFAGREMDVHEAKYGSTRAAAHVSSARDALQQAGIGPGDPRFDRIDNAAGERARERAENVAQPSFSTPTRRIPD